MTDTRDTGVKWIQLAAIALSVFLTMALWFSTSSVGRQLQGAWELSDGQLSWLTVSVQVGFVFGTLISAVLNLSDRLRADRLLAISAFAGAIANGLIPYLAGYDENADAFPAVIALRFVTGMTLAGVYPPGMKLMASWFARNRGLASDLVLLARNPLLVLAVCVDRRVTGLGGLIVCGIVVRGALVLAALRQHVARK